MGINLITGLILSGAIGFSLGMIGGGGSIITVPVLVYVLNVEPHEAIAMSLAVVGATSLVGAFLNWRRGTLQFKSGMIFGGAGIVGALVGSPLTHLFSPSALLMIFAGLMLFISILMLRRKARKDIENSTHHFEMWKALAAGLGVGILTGFLGVGGGFLIVPALVMFGGLPMKEAVGTSLLVIFLNCIAGLIGHLSQGAFDWQLTFLVTALAVGGTIGGTLLSHRIAAGGLQKGFAVFVFAVAVFLIAKNYTILL